MAPHFMRLIYNLCENPILGGAVTTPIVNVAMDLQDGTGSAELGQNSSVTKWKCVVLHMVKVSYGGLKNPQRKFSSTHFFTSGGEEWHFKILGD